MRFTLMLALAVLFANRVLAAPAPPQSDPAAPRSPQFAESFAKWKKTLAELRELQEKYQVADDAEKPKIEARFKQVLAEGKKLAPQLVAAAEKEFVAAPNKDREISGFLLNSVDEQIRNRQFKEAERLASVLIANKIDDKNVYLLAGVAAFELGDYAAAQKHMKAAAGAGLGEEGKSYLEEAKIRAAEAKADDLPRVKLATSKGDIVVELFENEAPNTVANFVSLVEKKFYDGVKFHRVIEGFMAQGGDPTGSGGGGPGYRILCECKEPNFRRHFTGSLSMAHAGPDTGGSQFFLTFGRTQSTSNLDGKHTVFGRVVEGADVLAKIQRFDPANPPPGAPPKLDVIVKATVVRKRKHAYAPKTLPEERRRPG